MIFLRSIENHGGSFESLRIGGIAQVSLAEVVRDDARFHDRGIEQVAVQDDEACVVAQRLLERADDLRVLNLVPLAVLCERAAVDRAGIFPDQAVLQQLVHYGRHAAGVMIVLTEVGARGLQVHEQRYLMSVRLPILKCQLDSEVAGNRGEMDRRIGRSADRRVHHDCVEE